MFFCHKWDILFHFAHSAPKKRNISLINAKKCIFWRVATRKKSEHFISFCTSHTWKYVEKLTKHDSKLSLMSHEMCFATFPRVSKSSQYIGFHVCFPKLALVVNTKSDTEKKKLFMTYCTEKGVYTKNTMWMTYAIASCYRLCTTHLGSNDFFSKLID